MESRMESRKVEEYGIEEEIVKYSIFAWKMAVPNVTEDGEEDDDDDGHGTRVRGTIITVIRSDKDPSKFISLKWACLIDRKRIHDSNGQEVNNVKALVSCYNLPRVFPVGYLKVSMIDQGGKIIPGRQYVYVCLNEQWFMISNTRSPIKFENLQTLSDNTEDQYFVCFELYIAVDEKHMTGLNRSTNDLSLLLDESLLTDSVLRVSGQEIMVHRAILAARWPRFYDNFLAGSKDSVVDVGEIELEAFNALLKCVYSNRILASFFHDEHYKNLATILEHAKLLEHIQIVEQQQNADEPSTNIVLVNDDESDPDYQIPETEMSAQKSITYRSFRYSTVITKETYNQSTTTLDSDFETVFPGELGNDITAIWKISLKMFCETNQCNYSRLKLIALENASSVRARTRLNIFNSNGENQFELNAFDQYDLHSEERYCLDSQTMNSLGSRFLVNHLLDGDELTIYLSIDVQISDLAGQMNVNSFDDLGNLLADGLLSDVVLRVGDQNFPVHRAILAARSPVFRAMFTSNMKESVAEEIQIEDMEPDVMEELLRCVYTDQVPVECRYDM